MTPLDPYPTEIPVELHPTPTLGKTHRSSHCQPPRGRIRLPVPPVSCRAHTATRPAGSPTLLPKD